MNVKTSETTRRDFLAHCTAAGILGVMSSHFRSEAAESDPAPDWATMLDDPVYKMFVGPPDLERILALFPRLPEGHRPAILSRSPRTSPSCATIPEGQYRTSSIGLVCEDRACGTLMPRFAGTIPSTASGRTPRRNTTVSRPR